jgi:hypothetical protein
MSFSSILENNFIQEINEKAKVEIANDRSRYDEIWDIIETYCMENKLMISNLYELLDKKDDISFIYNKTYNIYTSNPFLHGNNLTNIIHEKSTDEKKKKYIKFKTVKEQEEFIIEYDFRIVATLYKIQKFRSANEYHEPDKIVKPVNKDGLLLLPSEIEIIDVYHKLYDITKFDEWQKMTEFEDLLFNQFKDRFKKGLIGGYDSCKERKKDFIESLKFSIVKDWLPEQKNVILIGTWAFNWLTLGDNICTDIDKIQFISLMNYQELLIELQKYILKFSKFKISVRQQELHIPKDFRMNRYTYYIHIISERGTVEKPFLDLFNCAEFEIIPYTKTTSSENNIVLNIGNKYVMLRFLFIDLWVLRLIETMGLISKDILNIKINKNLTIIEKIRDKLGVHLAEGNFMGIYKDYDIAKKRMLLEGKKFYPYYPHIHYAEKGKYRIIY